MRSISCTGHSRRWSSRRATIEHCRWGLVSRSRLDDAETLSSGSRHVLLAANSKMETALRRRLTTDAFSLQNAHPGTNYAWLRLARMGNTFVGHVSTNGFNWEYAWHTTINLPAQVEAGLAITAHSYGALATAMFTNVVVGRLRPFPAHGRKQPHASGSEASHRLSFSLT